MGWGPTLATLIGSLYFFLIYPLAAIYRCGKNERLGWFVRLLWIIAVAITGPVAAAIYFLRHPVGKNSRWIAIVSFVFMIFFTIQTVQSINNMISTAHQEYAQDLASLDSAFQANVQPPEKAAVIEHLGTLQSELSSLPWSAVMRRLSLIAVEQSLAQMHARGALGKGDVSFWEGLFNDRTTSVFDLELRIQTHALSGDQI